MGIINILGERKRKLPILKIILLGIIGFSFVTFFINIFVTKPFDSVMELVPGSVFVLFALLYLLARYGFLILPSMILVGLSSLLAYYLSFRWGTDIASSWVLLMLSVIITGVIFSARIAFFLTFIHAIVIISIAHLQIQGIFTYEWWDIAPSYGSLIVLSVIFLLISTVSWLSNREIEKALKRARESEMALWRERDMLEVNVAEKTRQLQQVWEKERMNMQEFASIGRHTIGVIHDLVTPLTTLSLNLKMLKTNSHSRLITKATQASDQIERYIEMTRQKLSRKDTRTNFSVSEEITKAKKSLVGKLKASQVKILSSKSQFEIFGNPPSFHQLVLNLLDNAIDSYANPTLPSATLGASKKREVLVDIKQNKHHIFLTVTDYGHGIALRDRKRIFDPFFTTKGTAGKMGIGLSICKEIAEKDFGGTIRVKSKLNQGATFVIKLPILKKKYERQNT